MHSLAGDGRICRILEGFDLGKKEFCITAYVGDDNGLWPRFLDCVFSAQTLSFVHCPASVDHS